MALIPVPATPIKCSFCMSFNEVIASIMSHIGKWSKIIVEGLPFTQNLVLASPPVLA
jgi:hypothetical protein